MSWQLKICSMLIILGLCWSCFGSITAQEPQNGDFKALKTKVGGLAVQWIKRLQNAIFGVWQITLDKTTPFLAYAGKVMEKRKDIIKQEFKKEIDEMRGDCVKLFKFLWNKVISR